MSLVVNTNLGSLSAQRSLATSSVDLKQAMERLSTGKKINTAADDAAGFAIAERMTAQIRGLNMATKTRTMAWQCSQSSKTLQTMSLTCYSAFESLQFKQQTTPTARLTGLTFSLRFPRYCQKSTESLLKRYTTTRPC